MRRGRLPSTLCCALLLAGCDGDSTAPLPPLEVTSILPADGASEVETGAVVEVAFNQEIDRSSLTPQTLRVTLGGEPLPTGITYDPSTHTARAAAPFLPDGTYAVELTTEVRTPDGSGLEAGEQWTFGTRPWEAIAVDTTGEYVGWDTSLKMDGNGRLHVSYHDINNGNLKYATCAAACANPDSWEVLLVEGTGNVGRETSLAVDGAGRIHITYRDFTNADLKYATCAAACTISADNWQIVAVDTAGNVGYDSSLAVDADGRLHVTYYDDGARSLTYATCATSCATADSWQTVAVDPVDVLHTSLAVDGTGRLHVSYQDDVSDDLRYATCPASCVTAAAWELVTVDGTGNVGTFSSLAVDGGGRIHVSYHDGTNYDLKYATCANSCATAASWGAVTVDTAGQTGRHTALGVDGAGRVHIAYAHSARLRYGTCATGCTAAASWKKVTVDAVVSGSLGWFSSLVVGEGGRLHVTYYDSGSGNLKFIE